jgi:hypothetical protein
MRIQFGGFQRPGVLFALFFAGALSLFGQTAAEMETLLTQKSISWASAARFTVEAAGAAVPASPREAFEFAANKGWLPEGAEENGIARLDGVALLLMGAFDVSGGIFYSLFKNPHYAYRELVYKNIIQGKVDPAMTVSGDYFFFMLGKLLSSIEEAQEEASTQAAGRKEKERGEAKQSEMRRQALARRVEITILEGAPQ